MNEETAFYKLFCSLAIREYKVGNYELYVSDLRDVWYVKPGVRANRKLAEYLLWCCRKMNEFYPGICDIRVESLYGRKDSDLIGVHRISEIITDNEQVCSLIRRGEFAPPQLPGLNLVEASILESGLNGYLANGRNEISRDDLVTVEAGDLEKVARKLSEWQSEGYLQILANPLGIGPKDVCVRLLKPISGDE